MTTLDKTKEKITELVCNKFNTNSKIIGSGTYCVVLNISENEVVKVYINYESFRKEYVDKLEYLDESVLRETMFAKLFSHPNILHPNKIIVDPLLGICHVLDRMTPLVDLCREFTREMFYQLAISILGAIKHINSLSFIHSDIKPANIMYRKEGTKYEFKLIDFNITQYHNSYFYYTQWKKEIFASPSFSPDKRNEYRSIMIDIYMLGSTLLYMLLNDCNSQIDVIMLKSNCRKVMRIVGKKGYNLLQMMLCPIHERSTVDKLLEYIQIEEKELWENLKNNDLDQNIANISPSDTIIVKRMQTMYDYSKQPIFDVKDSESDPNKEPIQLIFQKKELNEKKYINNLIDLMANDIYLSLDIDYVICKLIAILFIDFPSTTEIEQLKNEIAPDIEWKRINTSVLMFLMSDFIPKINKYENLILGIE